MKNRKRNTGVTKKIIGIIGMIMISILNSRAQDAETEKIMPFVTDSSYCLECHSQEELDTQYPDTAEACDDYCRKCHTDMEAHHGVGMEVPGDAPAGLPLKTHHRLGCTTCHNLKIPRYDTKPWKSQSLFGKIFAGKSKYKTYFLVKINNNGQLCKECH